MFRNLRAEMLRRGLTQIDMAQAMRISMGSVSMRLNGHTPWKLDEAIEVKAWLGTDMSLEELFKWTEV